MNIFLGQINTTPRDFLNNTNKAKICLEFAGRGNGDLLVLPEKTFSGYLDRDLVYQTNFVEKNLNCLYELIQDSKTYPNLTIVVGYIDKNRKGFGKPFTNNAAVIKNGIITATYTKQLLPFYDVFDEGRYYEPGNQTTVIEINGLKFGICICEDVWNDKGSDDYNYKTNPLQQYRELDIQGIISINSSPFVQGKPEKRLEMIRQANFSTFIYLNQVGGQDELVFDGHSFVISKNSSYLCGPDEGCFNVSLNTIGNNGLRESTDRLNPDLEIYNSLKIGLRDYVHKSGFKEVVVGSSGGIDSAFVIALACDALGPENVHAVRMPSIFNSEQSTQDAIELHQKLGCHDYVVPINHQVHLDAINQNLNLKDYNKIADQNIQARLRAITLYHFSNAKNYLVLTTGNKTELMLGYCTLHGDMAGGFAPISDCYKLEVYRLADYYNKNILDAIPKNIFKKAPSAELAANQKDESDLLPYLVLDNIVRQYCEDHIDDYNLFKFKHLIELEDYNRIIKMIDKNEFKRRTTPPGIKIHSVAIGSGRRIPICKG